MKSAQVQRFSVLALVLTTLSLFFASCTTTQDTRSSQGELRQTWPKRFREPAILVADEITIEGPPGLLNHVATEQNPEAVDYEVTTTPNGLLQSAVVRQNANRGNVQAQLDGWTLVATRRMQVLERPGRGPVRVLSKGNAYWHPQNGEFGQIQRGAKLEFVGESED